MNNHRENKYPTALYLYVKRVLNQLKPFLYSQSDFVKRTVAMAINSLCECNLNFQMSANNSEINLRSEIDKPSETIQFLEKQLYKIDLDEFMSQTKFDDIYCNKIPESAMDVDKDSKDEQSRSKKELANKTYN